jgi:hypothetical protein
VPRESSIPSRLQSLEAQKKPNIDSLTLVFVRLLREGRPGFGTRLIVRETRPEEELVDRKESPWDDPDRRPSHADKRRAWRRELLADEIRAVLHARVTEKKIRALAERLLALAA